MTEIQTVTAGAEARTSWSCPLTYLVSARRDRETGTQWRLETDSDLSALSLSLIKLPSLTNKYLASVGGFVAAGLLPSSL